VKLRQCACIFLSGDTLGGAAGWHWGRGLAARKGDARLMDGVWMGDDTVGKGGKKVSRVLTCEELQSGLQ
jgi:hypothetical protein